MEIRLASVRVDDQEKALKFYTEKPGFVKQTDIPMGPFRWLTVAAPEDTAGVELVLEPMAFRPLLRINRRCLRRASRRRAFITRDIQAEYERLKSLGVVFRGEPTQMGSVTAVIFEDTCGNLINLAQPAE
jgi:catechol 2,3-dioxygenase-like lactoylglutathione lyase family enzyme